MIKPYILFTLITALFAGHQAAAKERYVTRDAVLKEHIHTWHEVSLNDPDDMEWTCQLGHVSETQYFFVNKEKKTIQTFQISNSQPFSFGMGLKPGADFNMMYSLACMRNDKQITRSPKTVFMVRATAPQQPEILVNNFDGGLGSWEVSKGVGENFNVSLNDKSEF